MIGTLKLGWEGKEHRRGGEDAEKDFGNREVAKNEQSIQGIFGRRMGADESGKGRLRFISVYSVRSMVSLKFLVRLEFVISLKSQGEGFGKGRFFIQIQAF